MLLKVALRRYNVKIKRKITRKKKKKMLGIENYVPQVGLENYLPQTASSDTTALNS